MTESGGTRWELADEIVTQLVRRYSTATVLFHHAVAERLGLGPTDHKCLDLLQERGPLSGSELAALTGLTTGAVTGVVARLERAGYLTREPDRHDRRKQVLRSAPEWTADLTGLFDSVREEADALLDGFDEHQLVAVAEFLRRGTDFGYRQAARLRADTAVTTRRRRTPLRPEEKSHEH